MSCHICKETKEDMVARGEYEVCDDCVDKYGIHECQLCDAIFYFYEMPRNLPCLQGKYVKDIHQDEGDCVVCEKCVRLECQECANCEETYVEYDEENETGPYYCCEECKAEAEEVE